MHPITMLAVSAALWALVVIASVGVGFLFSAAVEGIATWQTMPVEQIALGVRP